MISFSPSVSSFFGSFNRVIFLIAKQISQCNSFHRVSLVDLIWSWRRCRLWCMLLSTGASLARKSELDAVVFYPATLRHLVVTVTVSPGCRGILSVRRRQIESFRTGSEEKTSSRSATAATVATLSSNSKSKSAGQQHRNRRRHTSGMAVSFGIERRGSGRTSPRRSLGSALVDRMASFRSVQSAPVPVPSASEEINEPRSCLSERFPLFIY